MSDKFDTYFDECEYQAMVAGKSEGQSGGIQSDPGECQSPLGEKPEAGQSYSREQLSGGQDDGENEEDGAVTEGSQAG